MSLVNQDLRQEVVGMGDSTPHVPFGDALVEAVKGLRGQPPLLGAVAIAIVLAAVAIAAGDVARAISLPLLGLLALGLLAWVYADTRRLQRNQSGVLRNTHFGAWSKQKQMRVKHGNVAEGAGAGARISEEVKTGIGSSQEGVTIEYGDVTTH